MSNSAYGRPFTMFLRRIPAWKIALIAAAVLAVVAALVVVAGAVFLLILPVILVAGIAHRLFGGRPGGAPRGAPVDRAPHADQDVIEGVFVSVSEERREVEARAPPDERRE